MRFFNHHLHYYPDAQNILEFLDLFQFQIDNNRFVNDFE